MSAHRQCASPLHLPSYLWVQTEQRSRVCGSTAGHRAATQKCSYLQCSTSKLQFSPQNGATPVSGSKIQLVPPRGCQEPRSYCSVHSADTDGASSSPETTLSPLHTHTHTQITFASVINGHVAQLETQTRQINWDVLTKIHGLVAPRADVGSSRKGRETCS